ncbi:hypothetical protein M758_10G010900 [Ceratodon purpureus]|uniref:Uncharacterized protein n=1 Tax=Ceratodon purpureus TaxID=3225 RepID=A0A8T0GME3_CERPU|nr:hypothetical protein KC19_10G011700 [Ceratodon purpureus]KAG0602386.1 hypothetical protein M758_10G010900 [Ceratodon purpureus]
MDALPDSDHHQDDADAGDLHDGDALDLGEIREATPLLQHPAGSTRSQILTDHPDPDTDVDVDAPEESDSPIVSNRDPDVKVPKETHDLRALATTGNKMSNKNNRAPNFCSVDVVGPDGVIKRFAPGTKAAFAVERFNCQLKDPALPVVCIVAYKDGEDPIEFGPDVELVSYDDSWTLKTLREGTGAVQYEDPVHKLKDSIKEGAARAISSLKPVTKVPGFIFDAADTKQNQSTKPTRKSVEDMDPLQYFGVKNWEDLYPGGKLPEGGSQDCSPAYIGKVLLMFIFVFAFAGGLSYMLERLPDPTRPF